MQFVWFSFGPDSRCLQASVRSVMKFAAKEGDCFLVSEQLDDPISKEVREELVALGVRFSQRGGCNNLNGSKEAAVSIILQMIEEAERNNQTEVWKIDSDTLITGDSWRERFNGFDQMGPERPDRLASMGFSYLVRVETLRKVLGSIDTLDYRRHRWAEDFVISNGAITLKQRVHLIPFSFDNGPWAAWSYRTTATEPAYRQYEVVTFGNRTAPELTGSDNDRRRQAGEAMHRMLSERLAFLGRS